MTDPDQAVQTQFRNIERDTGRSLAEWGDVVRSAGLDRHGSNRQDLWMKIFRLLPG